MITYHKWCVCGSDVCGGEVCVYVWVGCEREIKEKKRQTEKKKEQKQRKKRKKKKTFFSKNNKKKKHKEKRQKMKKKTRKKIFKSYQKVEQVEKDQKIWENSAELVTTYDTLSLVRCPNLW